MKYDVNIDVWRLSGGNRNEKGITASWFAFLRGTSFGESMCEMVDEGIKLAVVA